MSNSIFDWPASLKRFVRFTSAKAEEVNDALDDLSAGLDTVEADIKRAVKLPVGTADQTLALAAGQRAGLLLGFDPSGNIAGIAGGGRWRGDWSAGTQYVITDYFRDPVSKSIYACVEPHTSTSIAADLAANKVRLAIDVAEVENQRILAQQAATAANGSYLLAAQKASDAAQSAVDAANNGAAQVTLAAQQVTLATQKAQDADAARAAAVVAQQGAEAALDSFDDRYIGQKPADPATDNDGGALVIGALYFRTTAPIGMKVWTGTAWDDAYANLSSKFDKTGGDVNGNINLTGTARRITGDFSNATASNRLLFQTSVGNGNTTVGAVPNGSGGTSGFAAYAKSDATNSELLTAYATATSSVVAATKTGSGNFTPLLLLAGDLERLRIDPTTGNVLAVSGALGYGVGAGGTVVQATSKATAVTLNKPSGQITMHNASLTAGASVVFQVTNALVVESDTITVTASATLNYRVEAVVGSGGGYFLIRVTNIGSTEGVPLKINFAMEKVSLS